MTPSSFACVSSGMLLISSKKIVPVSANSKRPFFACKAPVNAPFTWPNRFDSNKSCGKLPEFTVINGQPARVEFVCNARAINSLPVPLCPSIRIVVRLGAACIIRSNTSRIRELRPTMSENLCVLACKLWRSVRFSTTNRLRSTAFRRTFNTSSCLNGFVI